jgi:two-component system chemotaxis response regulator CheY
MDGCDVTVNLAMPILVVEDSRTMGQIVTKMLTLIGFKHVDFVFDGASALAKLRERDYGLIISDWNMQPTSGHAFLLEVRADPQLKSIPFIVISADSTLAAVTAAKEAGASNYIVKPFTGVALKEKISDVFGSGAVRPA